jgi:hypothetical protein
MSCRGLGVARQLILFSLDSMGSGHCVQVGWRFHNIYRGSHLHLLKQLWLAVDEVVHHDNVMAPIVVRTRGHIAGLDAD